MIYWLKRLEWKIRKALGLREKRIKTVEDVSAVKWRTVRILIIISFSLIIAHKIGWMLSDLWLWFFPPRHWLPVIPI